jgi:dipeptidyl aminopeptidase/acylaminoacyl peptidase
VTGVIIVPFGTPPVDGFPVVSWGHGTNGMADVCAPSLSPSSAAPLANSLLDRGWVVTASDYQGEGTPGLMPYLAGVSAARNTIDIVRAARRLPAAHASTRYVVWGHSEGGQTAMFSLNIAASYAPGLSLQGVVAGAPPSQFSLIYTFLKNSPFRHYLLMAAGGLNVAYGNTAAPLGQVLTPLGIQKLKLLDKGCTGYIVQHLAGTPTSKLVKGDPFKVPAWKKILEANDPQGFTHKNAAPLLMIQGSNDEQIPPISTQLLMTHMCNLGQTVQRWLYPGQSHAGVINPSANDMLQWISDRFAGGINPDPYAPTGLPGIDTSVCN